MGTVYCQKVVRPHHSAWSRISKYDTLQYQEVTKVWKVSLYFKTCSAELSFENALNEALCLQDKAVEIYTITKKKTSCTWTPLKYNVEKIEVNSYRWRHWEKFCPPDDILFFDHSHQTFLFQLHDLEPFIFEIKTTF